MKISATSIFRPRSDIGRFVSAYISPAVHQAVEESCALIESRAKEFCPVDTGALQSSIHTVVEDTSSTVKGTVSTGVDYAAYVEFGTGIRGAASAGAGEGPYDPNWPGMPAQPYMRPAYDYSKAEIFEIFSNDLTTAIKVSA